MYRVDVLAERWINAAPMVEYVHRFDDSSRWKGDNGAMITRAVVVNVSLAAQNHDTVRLSWVWL